jgi:hypothetical protein
VDILLLPILVFGAAGAAGIGVLTLGWPLLVAREHRRRVLAMLALMIVMVVCATFGQYMLDAFGSWCGARR